MTVFGPARASLVSVAKLGFVSESHGIFAHKPVLVVTDVVEVEEKSGPRAGPPCLGDDFGDRWRRVRVGEGEDLAGARSARRAATRRVAGGRHADA
jgi:hypothetical protein